MDLSIILTYRCQSHCSMCHVWQHPTLPAEEITPATLAKLPAGFGRLVLTGGEPTLRADLAEIVDLLLPKTRRLEISTNGLQSDKLEHIVQKHPGVGIRISLDGFGAKNDSIRGEKNGFERKRLTLERLFAAGGRDLGFATVVQDDNADQLLDLYKLCDTFGGEMVLAALHNGYQFHKIDNEPTNRVRTARAVLPLLAEMLRSRRPRNWARAYASIGLAKKILGQRRRMPCPAGRGFLFLDPWGRVYACNIRPDLEIGDLTTQLWREIVKGPRAAEARTRVARCTHNCWLDGHARAARRAQRIQAGRWFLANKLRAACGLSVDFDRAVDFSDVAPIPIAPRRESWLGKVFRPTFLRKTEQPYGAYSNGMNK